MKEPILSREEVKALYSRHFSNPYDLLPLWAEAFSAALESSILEKLCGEPIPYGYEFLDMAGTNHFVRGSLPSYAQSEIVPLYTLKDRQS